LISCRYDAGNENVTLCNATDNPTLTQLGTGQVTFGGNVDAGAGLDVTGNTTTTGGTVTITTTDADDCFIVKAEGNEELISCRYDAGNENVTLCNATDNPTLTQLGTGQVTFGGNVDANAGLDVSGAILTAASGISTSVKNFSDNADGDLEVVDSNKVIIVTNSMAGGKTITLPAVAGATGVHYLIKIAINLTGTLTIQSDADTELLVGGVLWHDTNNGSHISLVNVGADHEKLTLDATTKNGTWIDITCNGTSWYVTGNVFADESPSSSSY
jgi:hypothetical protein